VVGAVRPTSTGSLGRLQELGIADQVEFADFDLLEESNIIRTIDAVRPDEIYNLAAQSFVAASFEQPVYTTEVDACGVVRLLEAIRVVNPAIRFYQASTSEMFGKVREIPQSEETPFHPRSPYGVAKLYGHWIVVNYHEAHGLHASSGILFNHESPLRGRQFVTRKITVGLAEAKHGKRDAIELGNLDARRDWGFAGDYVEGIWRMVQQPEADTFVLASGENHSVREFLSLAAGALGFDLGYEGKGVEERAVDRRTGRLIARVNRKFFRPAEVDILLGNPAKAERVLGWRRRMSFPDLVAGMAEADERRARDGTLVAAGHAYW
jgi:GDPmannose 4,6-dehydratase